MKLKKSIFLSILRLEYLSIYKKVISDKMCNIANCKNEVYSKTTRLCRKHNKESKSIQATEQNEDLYTSDEISGSKLLNSDDEYDEYYDYEEYEEYTEYNEYSKYNEFSLNLHESPFDDTTVIEYFLKINDMYKSFDHVLYYFNGSYWVKGSDQYIINDIDNIYQELYKLAQQHYKDEALIQTLKKIIQLRCMI